MIQHVGFDEDADGFVPRRYLAVPDRRCGFVVTIRLIAWKVIGSCIGPAIGSRPFALVSISTSSSAPPASRPAFFRIRWALSNRLVTLFAIGFFAIGFLPCIRVVDGVDLGGIGEPIVVTTSCGGAIPIPFHCTIDSFAEAGWFLW